MNVALVHRFFWREGAVPTVLREWAGHLEAAGHDVTVFASDVHVEDGTRTRRYVTVPISRGKAFDIGGCRFAFRLFRALRQRPRPTAVLCLDSTAYYAVWAYGRLHHVPTVIVPQGWIYGPGRAEGYPRTVAWMYKVSAHFCARLAPMIGCISREIYDGMYRLGAEEHRLWLAPNCVDLSVWDTSKAGARERDERQLLFAARFRSHKGLGVLLEALPAVLKKIPNLRVRLYGSEEPEGGEHRSRARELGLDERVAFPGLAPREAMPGIYADADALVLPSFSEGHALAPLECLASGTPVIGSDIPGIRETVEDEVNGLLVPPGDPKALAEAICRLLGDRALLDRLSRAARASVERFGWPPRIREFEELVARMHGGRRADHG
jgi:glycosyltransferase involved in cell wall biosynthesis